LAGQRHKLLGSKNVRGDEGVVKRTQSLELRGDGPGEQRVGAGQQLQMQIRLLGNLRAQRVDDHQLAARALCFANAPDKMKIGDRRVVAPDNVELGVLGELRRASKYGAIGPRPRLAAHAAA